MKSLIVSDEQSSLCNYSISKAYFTVCRFNRTPILLFNACMSTFTCIYYITLIVCACTHTTHTYIHTSTHTYTHTHAHIHMHTHVYTCAHNYIIFQERRKGRLIIGLMYLYHCNLIQVIFQMVLFMKSLVSFEIRFLK